jgi:hypothetical protein
LCVVREERFTFAKEIRIRSTKESSLFDKGRNEQRNDDIKNKKRARRCTKCRGNITKERMTERKRERNKE